MGSALQKKLVRYISSTPEFSVWLGLGKKSTLVTVRERFIISSQNLLIALRAREQTQECKHVRTARSNPASAPSNLCLLTLNC